MSDKPRRAGKGGMLEGRGYYIVLLLCAAAIGISGYFLIQGLLTSVPSGFGQDPTAAVSGQAELERQREEIRRQDALLTEPDKPEETETAATPSQAAPEAAPAPEPAPPQETAAPAEPEPAAYVWPVEGSIERDFSLEVFAYDATMGDWRTHEGLDIAAEAGAPVSACAPGTVESVAMDDMLGRTVTVDHGGGLRSAYANLAEEVSVQEGDPVEAGTVLGTVGATAISESAGASHLHFSMTEYGVPADPMNYLH